MTKGFDIAKAATKAYTDLATWRDGPELDVTRDSSDPWTKDYATFVVDITEPDDDQRRYFDLDQARTDIRDRIAKFFPGAIRLSDRDKDPPSGTILRIRTLRMWGLEVEVYNKKGDAHAQVEPPIEQVEEPWLVSLVELSEPLLPGSAMVFGTMNKLVYEVRKMKTKSTSIAGERRDLFAVMHEGRTGVLIAFCLNGRQREWALTPKQCRTFKKRLARAGGKGSKP